MLTTVFTSGSSSVFGTIGSSYGAFYTAGAVAVAFVTTQIVLTVICYFMILRNMKNVAALCAWGGLVCSIISWTVYVGLLSPGTGTFSGIDPGTGALITIKLSLNAGFALQVIYTGFQIIYLWMIYTMSDDGEETKKVESTSAPATVVVAPPPPVSAATAGSSLPPPPPPAEVVPETKPAEAV